MMETGGLHSVVACCRRLSPRTDAGLAIRVAPPRRQCSFDLRRAAPRAPRPQFRSNVMGGSVPPAVVVMTSGDGSVQLPSVAPPPSRSRALAVKVAGGRTWDEAFAAQLTLKPSVVIPATNEISKRLAPTS